MKYPVVTILLKRGFICLLPLWIICCKPNIEPLYPEKVVEIDPQFAENLAQEIQDKVSVTVAEGLQLSLWASDTLVNDPIAISIDDHGKVFYTWATRQTNSEFDVRSHRNWMEASISFRTVEDRRDFLRATFSETNQEGEQFLKDLNNDGQLDWKDLTVEKEQVWFIEDSNGDGLANRSQLYLEDFHEEITDVANGLEAFNGEVFIAVGPDMWRTSDRDKDGVADLVKSISHGYAVHIGFGAHGMSGAKIGPDGRIWWGIGDIGMNVVDQEGNRWEYPNRGVVVRSELDGSNFEVYAAGVRNTHEFVFDKYGNLISVDNDGDHRGERERVVYLINGSDTGWRINWQFGKYTDPKNNSYKVWMDENMHVPHQAGQAAYFLPPITNYVNGPTGMVYNPGSALSESWYEHFFVAEFRGTPVNSPLHAFTLVPRGASFEMESTREVVRGVLPTGVDFGPDGALYFSDWIDGWSPKGQGRVWKLDSDEAANRGLRREVQDLLAGDFAPLSQENLQQHLGHQDMRVRQKAQFELASRGKKGLEPLMEAITQSDNQLARVHGIWGIGQIARKDDLSQADALIPLLTDSDAEIVTQAAKILGDVRYQQAAEAIVPLTSHPSLRVQLHATEALGRMAYKPAFNAIVNLLEKNNDQDIWLRHAGMVALARLQDEQALASLGDHHSKAVRLAAVVALRRMKSPLITRFLQDQDEDVVTETARGINDDLGINEALPALAESLIETPFENEALIRRAINANLRVGNEENIDYLVNYVQRASAPAGMRGEALQAMSTWSNPSVFDRVDGRYLGPVERDDSYLKQELAPILVALLGQNNPEVQLEAARAAGKLQLSGTDQLLTNLAGSHPQPGVRSAALQALSELSSEGLTQALRQAFRDTDPEVRSTALAILPQSNIPDEQAVALFQQIMNSGTFKEQQVALNSLASLTNVQAVDALGKYLGWLENGKAASEIQLDIIEAVKAQNNQELNARLAVYEENKPEGPLSAYLETLRGGDRDKGHDIFYRNEAAQCVRCHTIFETGGTMGPGLAGVAARYSPEELLTALIAPSSSYAEGYQMVTLNLNNGETFTGLVESDNDQNITVKSGNQEARVFSKTDIAEITSIPSSMPPMGQILTKREIRDVLAFLITLKGEDH